jgi:polyhydroxybutyrate depolymerase
VDQSTTAARSVLMQALRSKSRVASLLAALVAGCSGSGDGDPLDAGAAGRDAAEVGTDRGEDAVGARAPYPAGVTDVTLDAGGPRRFRVYVPARLGASAPRAVVVALHGGGGQGLETSDPGQHPLAVFREVADREGFVVVYPEGSISADGRLGWTDCRADNRQASSADDLGFLRAVVARLRADYGLPASRVFMTGTSNGALMTLAFAAADTDQLGAIAVSSGNLPESPRPGACTTGPSRPLAALFTHGAADSAMPYAGGCVSNLGGGCTRGRVISAEATRDAYLARNGLSPTFTSTATVEVDATDPGTAERFVYAGAAPVEWWRLNGAGHPPPSRRVPVAPTPASGAQNRDIEFAEVAWAFFAARL